MFLRILAATAAMFLASCGSPRLSAPDISPYRMEIQQGNFISQETVSQLKLGMTKDQVRFVLGTPLITDSFHADRWDYVFRRQRSNSKVLEQHKLAVFFEDGKLARMDTDVISAAGADAAAIKTPETVSPAPAAKAAAPAAKPEVTKPPAPVAAPEPKPAATTATAAENPPAEKKSWWERLKDKVR